MSVGRASKNMQVADSGFFSHYHASKGVLVIEYLCGALVDYRYAAVDRASAQNVCGNWELASIDQLMSDLLFLKVHSALASWGWCTDDQCLPPSDSFQTLWM